MLQRFYPRHLLDFGIVGGRQFQESRRYEMAGYVKLSLAGHDIQLFEYLLYRFAGFLFRRLERPLYQPHNFYLAPREAYFGDLYKIAAYLKGDESPLELKYVPEIF